MITFGCLYLLFFPAISFFYSLNALKRDPVNWKRYIFFLIYAFFIGAYVFETEIGNFDLVRYIPIIEKYGNYNLLEIIQINRDFLYSRDLFFWIFGYLNIPHMVPAISTAAVYSIAFFITCDTAERYKQEKLIFIVILFQIAMLPYVNLINNVRNVFAFSLIILAAYLDLVKNKRNWFVVFCYIFGCLMHLAAFSLIICRLLCRPLKKVFTVIMLIPLIVPSSIYFLYSIRNLISIKGDLGNVIVLIIMKLYWYLTDYVSPYAVLTDNSITVKVDRIIMVAGMVSVLLVIYSAFRSNNSYFKDDKGVYTFVGMVSSLTLSCIYFPMPMFWRYAAALYTMAGIILIPALSGYQKMSIIIKTAILIFSFISILNFLLQIWKCTWFEFGNWVIAFVSSNFMSVFFDFVNGTF